MRRILLPVVVLLIAAAPASANTAAEALLAPYKSSDMFRPAGSPNDVWNTPIPADATVQPDSAAQTAFMVGALGRTPGKWWFSVYVNYVADADVPLSSVCLGHAVDGSFAATWPHYMAEHEILVTEKVPVPSDPSGTLPSLDGGADRGATIYQPSSNKMWDFYQFRKAPPGQVDQKGRPCDYMAAVAARMRTVGTQGGAVSWQDANPGYFRNDPPNEFRDVARRASKLPTMAGAILPGEWNDPSATDGFGHVIQVTLPWGRHLKWEWPAAKTDSWSRWSYPMIREGSKFRFASDADCGRWDAEIANSPDPLKLYYRRVQGICVTGKKYGFIGGDQTGKGFALNFRGGVWDADRPATATVPAGKHTPDQYFNELWAEWSTKLEVLNVQSHTEWAPGCEC